MGDMEGEGNKWRIVSRITVRTVPLLIIRKLGAKCLKLVVFTYDSSKAFDLK